MFLIIHIWIQKQTVIVYMVVLNMLQLTIMFTIMPWNISIKQLFHHYKRFTFVKMLSICFGTHSKIWKHHCWNEKEPDGWSSIITKMVIPNISYIQRFYQRKPRQVTIEAHDKNDTRWKNTIIFKLQVGYMTYPILKNKGHIKNRL